MSNTQQSTAAANALSGERTFQNVQFATTGDSEADAISGVLSVLMACGLKTSQSVRVLRYLTARAEDADKTARDSMPSFPPTNLIGSQMYGPISSGSPPAAGTAPSLPPWMLGNQQTQEIFKGHNGILDDLDKLLRNEGP